MSTIQTAFCNLTTDLEFVIPDVHQYDRRIPITGFLVYSTNIFRAGSTGTVDSCFRDSVGLGDAEANLAALTEDGEWFYDSTNDLLYLYSLNNPLTHHIVEAGRDYATLKEQAANRAYEFIVNYIGKAHFLREGTNIQGASARSHDEILIRSNAILACSFLIMPYDPDRGMALEKLVYDREFETGYLDHIKSGRIQLWHEVGRKSQEGVCTPISRNSSSTGTIINVNGKSTHTDKIKVKITTAGTFVAGTASPVKYTTYLGDATGFQMVEGISAQTINGSSQQIGHNMYAIFSEGIYTINDSWEVAVTAYSEFPETQQEVKSARAERASHYSVGTLR